MVPVTLHGELPQMETSLDWPTLASTMVVSSPEYQAAQTRVGHARANIDRQCVQAIPNFDVQFAAGTDAGTNSGLINLQVGAPIAVFNKNQGNIAAASVELMQACRKVEGLKFAETAYKAGETSFVQFLVARRTYFDTNLQYIASQTLLAQASARVDGYILTGALEAVTDNSGDDSLRGLTFSQQ